jgi:hypothetical protein
VIGAGHAAVVRLSRLPIKIDYQPAHLVAPPKLERLVLLWLVADDGEDAFRQRVIGALRAGGIESLCMHLPRHGDSIIVCDSSCGRHTCQPRRAGQRRKGVGVLVLVAITITITIGYQD